MPNTFLCVCCKKNRFVPKISELKKNTIKRAKRDGWRPSGIKKIICPICVERKFYSQSI